MQDMGFNQDSNMFDSSGLPFSYLTHVLSCSNNYVYLHLLQPHLQTLHTTNDKQYPSTRLELCTPRILHVYICKCSEPHILLIKLTFDTHTHLILNNGLHVNNAQELVMISSCSPRQNIGDLLC